MERGCLAQLVHASPVGFQGDSHFSVTDLKSLLIHRTVQMFFENPNCIHFYNFLLQLIPDTDYSLSEKVDPEFSLNFKL